MWRQLLKRLIALDCAFCEGFSTSGNAVFTSQEHAARTEVAYNLLDSMNRLAMGHGYYIIRGLAAFFQLRGARLTPSPSTMMVSLRQPKKREADSLGGEGGFESLLWVAVGRDERQIVHSTSSLLK